MKLAIPNLRHRHHDPTGTKWVTDSQPAVGSKTIVDFPELDVLATKAELKVLQDSLVQLPTTGYVNTSDAKLQAALDALTKRVAALEKPPVTPPATTTTIQGFGSKATGGSGY